MAYDDEVAHRVRECLQDVDGVIEKRMFGGLAFLLGGNMAVAASGHGGLMVRVDPAQSPALVERPEAARMVMRGREMDGWLLVATDDLDDQAFAQWVETGRAFAATLPAKGG